MALNVTYKSGLKELEKETEITEGERLLKQKELLIKYENDKITEI